jgi:hypothetical protein
MEVFSHKAIKRFHLEGQIHDDSAIARMREEYIRLLSDVMKDTGYVRRLDIEPDWSLQYTGNYYEFTLSVYGSYIGKKNATCIDSLDRNKPIYSQPSKSSVSSKSQESEFNPK